MVLLSCCIVLEVLVMNVSEQVYRILLSADNGEVITPENKKFLSQCQEVNWSFSTIVTTIPKHIYYLNNLHSLDLTGLNISSLPNEICRLSCLHTLILRGNNLVSLPADFSDLKDLKMLDLSRNKWEQFPTQIKNFKKLTYLNLSHCSFSHIPGWILNFNLDFEFQEAGRGIIMEKTSAPELQILTQPRSTIMKYYTKLNEGNLVVREAKVVFLGDGDAGKTYTVDRIKNDNKRLSDKHIPDQTKGISIVHKDFYYDGNPITINFWDFGGQHIMHAMHRCFLTGNTLYVIVLSGRTEVMERRLHYWMTTINSFVSSSCPVVVLQNLFEVKNETNLDRNKTLRNYRNIVDVLEINVKTSSESDFKHFVDILLNEAVKRTHYGVHIPKHWAGVKDALEKANKPFLSKIEFTKILEQQSPETIGDELEILDWLNEIGTSFSCHRAPYVMLKEYVVLNPEWATNAIYAIINSGSPQANGILEISEIENILKRTKFVNDNENINVNYSPGNIEYILQLMERYIISFRIPNYLPDEWREFIPSLCTNKEPDGIDSYIHRANLHFEIHYSYLPSNLLHQFMINNFTDLKNANQWWYNGGLFDSNSYQCGALVIREIVQNEDDRISIFIRNLPSKNSLDESWRYLEHIRKQIEEIGKKMNISPTGSYLYYSEPGSKLSERINIDKIKEYIKLGWKTYQSIVFRKEIPITELLRGISPINCAVSNQDLLSIIIAGCSYMQKRSWLPGKEDIRNDYLCDILRTAQVLVLDQSRSGTARTSSGELDFLFQDKSSLQDYAIMEALNLNNLNKPYIQKHITKLVDDNHYNPNGLKELYLLVYAEVDAFSDFCSRYEKFIIDAEYPSTILSCEHVEKTNRRNIAVWKVIFEDDTVLHHIVIKLKTHSTSL